jgi:hypothetical protein
MAQFGFFDADKRLNSHRPRAFRWKQSFAPWLGRSSAPTSRPRCLRPDEARKSPAGRKPIDAIVMFRMLVLQSLYNLSDEQVEYQVRDRLTFTRFLGLGFEAAFPTARRCGLPRVTPV